MPRRRSLARRLALPALLGAAAAAACSEVKTGPDTPVALSFDSLPAPSIVIGDTLRDSTGAAVPFRATAYNGDGDPIANAPIHWFVLTRDTTGRLTGDTVLLAVDSLTGTAVAPLPSKDSLVYARRAVNVTIVPQVNGLPGPSRQIALTLRPDSLAAPAAADSAVFRTTDTSLVLPLRTPISVSVLHDSASLHTRFLGVRAWPVSFSLEYHGQPLTDSTIAWVADVGSTRVSARDTTDAAGGASRRVLIRQSRLATAGTTAPDSLIMIVRATYRGADLGGSPARVVIRILPPATAR